MTQFYLVGAVPVKLNRLGDGTAVLEAFNRRTGRFEPHARYDSLIHRDDTGLVRAVTEAEFAASVAELQHPQSA